MVYILDQVRAMEEELLSRIKQQGLNVKPQILVVRLQIIRLGNVKSVGEGLTCFLRFYAGDSFNSRCKREQMQSGN